MWWWCWISPSSLLLSSRIFGMITEQNSINWTIFKSGKQEKKIPDFFSLTHSLLIVSSFSNFWKFLLWDFPSKNDCLFTLCLCFLPWCWLSTFCCCCCCLVRFTEEDDDGCKCGYDMKDKSMIITSKLLFHSDGCLCVSAWKWHQFFHPETHCQFDDCLILIQIITNMMCLCLSSIY